MVKPEEIISNIVVFSKYARYIPELKRRETFEEVVDRYVDMMVKKYPSLSDEIHKHSASIYEKKVLPSMRALQFAGTPIERNNARIYNCSYLAVDYTRAFAEAMFLLLGGSGVGYSVRKDEVNKLPAIKEPRREHKFLIGDSIEGWADAVNALMKAFFYGKPLPRFDFTDIREKGSRLVTTGGVAPGPVPLKQCLEKIQRKLERTAVGSKLNPCDVADIMCYIAKAVLAGGIRRAATICLFDKDDKEMLAFKSGEWWNTSPDRAMANVSVSLNRNGLLHKELDGVLDACYNSYSGEPGVFLTNTDKMGTNPCGEIALKPKGFCNLTTINASDLGSDNAELFRRVEAASFFGTLQAGFTDFHYLCDDWRKNAEEEALLGVSMTGICDNADFTKLDLKGAAVHAKETNRLVARSIGIGHALRVTCVKPEGTASLVLGTSSGCHPRHSEFYIRRFRFGKDEAIVQHFAKFNPALVVDDEKLPGSKIIEVPVRSPSRAKTRAEVFVSQLERIKFLYDNWVVPGHHSGDNTHNVSCTVSFKSEDVPELRAWMWENRYSYSGISLLPFDGGTYTQTPFEEIDEETYKNMLNHLTDHEMSAIFEEQDTTTLVDNVACAGGACEI